MKLFKRIQNTSISDGDRLSDFVKGHHFRDALSTEISNMSMTPSELQHAIFGHMPNWVHWLMSLRNKIVRIFGFEAGQENMTPERIELEVGDTAGFMTVKEKYNDEIISFAEDRHMEFYLSVAKRDQQVIVSTLVNQKTLIGRIYVTAILPFHYFVARAVIYHAIRAKRI